MSRISIIILAHGSRRGAQVAEIMEGLIHQVGCRVPEGVGVGWAALQFTNPTLEEAVASAIAEGAQKVLVIPYFLFEGIHLAEDIPEVLGKLGERYPELEFVLTSTLGTDGRLAEIVMERAMTAAPELCSEAKATPSQVSPQEIEPRSMEIIERLVPPLMVSAQERDVIKRIVHASGDPAIAPKVKFYPQAVSSGLAALQRGCPIFTDVKMVAAGINRRLADQFGCPVESLIGDPEVKKRARDAEITRAAAAMQHFGPRLKDSVIAIGNAPTALRALLSLVDEEVLPPALVVGMPVGFIDAAESKAELMKRDLPYISVEGTRGGSAMAVATVNALLKLAGGD